MQKIRPFLWFDTQAEEAANFYVSLFEDSEVHDVTRYSEGGPGPAGEVMTASFTLAARSDCEDQDEVDRLWSRLREGSDDEGQCGWLKDRFGLSWQIIPERLGELLGDPDPDRSQRAMTAMLQMRKIDVQALEDAANGTGVPGGR